jgi:HD-like signal output (HDOD) protein
MDLWAMPEEVVRGLRFQNAPEYNGAHAVYPNLMFVATRLLRRHGIGNAPLEPIPAEMFVRLHLDPEKAAEAIQTVVNASAELNSF